MLRDKILEIVVRQFLKRLSPDLFKKIVDAALDQVEQAVDDSENSFDDQTVLPLIATIRTAFNIPDDIGGDED